MKTRVCEAPGLGLKVQGSPWDLVSRAQALRFEVEGVV